MSLSVFDIPHILRTICERLSLQDQFHCALVSKTWYKICNSVVWRNLNVARTLLPEEQVALVRLQAQVWHIDTNRENTLDVLDNLSIPIPNLQSFTFRGDNTIIDSKTHDQQLRLVESHPQLYRLGFSFSIYGDRDDDGFKDRLIAALSPTSHPQLRELEMSLAIRDIRHLQQLLSGCGHIDTLSVRLLTHEAWDEASERLNEAEARAAWDRMEPTKIRNLTIEIENQLIQDVALVPLLRKCSQLERLVVPSVQSSTTWGEMMDLLRVHVHWPRLDDLIVPNHRLSDAELVECISAFGAVNIMAGSASSSRNGEESSGQSVVAVQARSMTLGDISQKGLIVAQAIGQNHARTLTSLVLGSSHCSLQPEQFLAITGHMEALQHLSIGCRGSTQNIFNRQELNLERIQVAMQRPWACRELRSLKFNFNIAAGGHQRGDGSFDNILAEYIATQIGQLAMLEDWEHNGYFGLLILEDGYLDRLTGSRVAVGAHAQPEQD
ncbi:hypothetical protein BGX28_005748 [Mortierella sp. GBA30]|nr:hypothetical protein BGX28_005748 [Mortierella sp. GBA30]